YVSTLSLSLTYIYKICRRPTRGLGNHSLRKGRNSADARPSSSDAVSEVFPVLPKLARHLYWGNRLLLAADHGHQLPATAPEVLSLSLCLFFSASSPFLFFPLLPLLFL